MEHFSFPKLTLISKIRAGNIRMKTRFIENGQSSSFFFEIQESIHFQNKILHQTF